MTSVSVYFLVLLLPLIDAARFRCDYSYIPYEGWFKLHREPTDHNTAKRICLKEGAELVLPLTKVLIKATLSLFEHNSFPATHINYEAARQRNKVRRGIIMLTGFNDLIIPTFPTVDRENTVFVLTRNGSFEVRPALEQNHFICHKKAGTAEELNECGTTDNEYTLDTRTGICYKYHRFHNTWSRAKEICTNEGGNLAVINSETEAQVIRDLIKSNIIDFRVPGDTMRDLAYVGIKSINNGHNWQTVDGHSLSMSGYEKWGSDGERKIKGLELCGTVKSNGLLYDNPCDQDVQFICEKKIQDCNDKYTPDIRTRNCYKFFRNRNTYDKARVLCMYEGGNLAVINSETDAQAIGDIFNRNPSFSIPGDNGPISAFLGKYKDVTRHPEKSVGGDSLSMYGYDKWAPGQQRQAVSNEKCVTVQRNGMLHASQCTLTVPFICEKPNQAEDCDGYTLDIRTGNCYKFHRLANIWSNAFQICTNEGGNLAVMNSGSEIEAQLFRDLFKSNPAESIPKFAYQNAAYLGIKRPTGVNWQWKTVGGEEALLNSTSGYDMWAPGEPNNAEGNEYCITVRRNGLLSDVSCERMYPFICEKKNEDCM